MTQSSDSTEEFIKIFITDNTLFLTIYAKYVLRRENAIVAASAEKSPLI